MTSFPTITTCLRATASDGNRSRLLEVIVCVPLSGDSMYEFTQFSFKSVITCTCTRALLCRCICDIVPLHLRHSSDPHSALLALPAVIDAHADDSLMHAALNSGVFCRKGPTGTRRVKGGVSGPAEDLRPVSEVGTG